MHIRELHITDNKWIRADKFRYTVNKFRWLQYWHFEGGEFTLKFSITKNDNGMKSVQFKEGSDKIEVKVKTNK